MSEVYLTKGTSLNFVLCYNECNTFGKRYTYSYIAIYGEDVKRLEINELWVCRRKQEMTKRLRKSMNAFIKIYIGMHTICLGMSRMQKML